MSPEIALLGLQQQRTAREETAREETAREGTTTAAPGVVSRSRVMALPDSGRLSELLQGCPKNLVFSNAEQRLCHRRMDLTGWGGRLAAKLAVCDLLDVDAIDALQAGKDIGLSQLEILPEPHGMCGDSGSCFKPHPPQVLLGPHWASITSARRPRTGAHFQVSISHTRQIAIALAVMTAGPLAEGR